MTCEVKVAFSLPVWKTVSANCKEVISELLAKKPEDRMTLDQLMNHPWLANMPALKEGKLPNIGNATKLELCKSPIRN